MKKKSLAAALVVIMILSNSNIGNAKIITESALEENGESSQGNDTTYVVVTQNDAVYDEISEIYSEQIVEDVTSENTSLENPVITMELTDEEVKSLEAEDKVLFVEENFEIDACDIGMEKETIGEEEINKDTESETYGMETDNSPGTEQKSIKSEENHEEETNSVRTENDKDWLAGTEVESETKSLFGVEFEEEDKLNELEEDTESSTDSTEIEQETEKTDQDSNADNQELEWNLQMIGVAEDNQNLAQSEEQIDAVKIAVLDSGIDIREETNVVRRVNLVQEEDYIPSYLEDVTGHGTSIAGLISDVDNEAEISSVRILNQENKATLSRVITGIYWCIENDIDIINMSIGTSIRSEAMHYAIKKADEAGIIMVAAAGNGGTGADVEYPAAFEEVIAVGAVDIKGEKTLESATGNEIELVAPGEQIKADGAFGGEIITAGTSLSVPQVVGVASVLLKKNTDKTPGFIRELMNVTAKKMGESTYYGNGLVDLEYALEHYKEFDNNYIEGIKEKNIVPENNAEIETFEKTDYVEGRWSGSLHQQLVDDYDKNNSGFSAKEIAAIKAYSIISDSNKNVINNVSQDRLFFKPADAPGRMHGYNQYVANTKYLFEIAAKMRDTKIASGQSKSAYVKAICNSVMYGGKGSSVNDYIVLDKAIMYMCVTRPALPEAYQGDVNRDFACRVLGVALHNVADTYAHKTVLTPGRCKYNTTAKSEPSKRDIKTFYKMDFNEPGSWESIVTDTGAKGKNREFGNLGGNGKYADATTFFPERYNIGANFATYKILHMYAAKQKSMGFGDIELMLANNSDYLGKYPEIKLRGLSTLVKNIFGKTSERFELFTTSL